jgi:hypothetical protein
MIHHEESNELLAQLRAALRESRQQEGLEVEICMLAGCLARRLDAPKGPLGPKGQQALDAARASLETAPDPGPTLADILGGLFCEDLADLDPDERVDEARDLDEACAAATWIGRPELGLEAVARARKALDASAPARAAIAPMAAEALAEAPPLPADPMRALWIHLADPASAR